jgi:hypothetical protein
MNNESIVAALRNYVKETEGDGCDYVGEVAKEKAFMAGIDCEKNHIKDVLSKLDNFEDLLKYCDNENPDLSIIIRSAYKIGYDKAIEDTRTILNKLL